MAKKNKSNLTTKQRRFVNAFDGNASEAARIAGYKSPMVEGHRLLRNAKIGKAIEAREQNKSKNHIATREERQAFWTEMMTGSKVADRDRLKASELLGRSQADFVERHEIAGRDGGPIQTEIKVDLTKLTDEQLAQYERLANIIRPGDTAGQ